MSDGFQLVIDAIERSGRHYVLRNGECNLRCPFCGDSVKSSKSKHFYINTASPHPFYCQRCGTSGGHISAEVLEALGATDREVSVYVRVIEKEERRRGRSRRSANATHVGRSRLVIPHPCRDDPDDLAAVSYIERRLGGRELEPREVERYKLICCGLYGFLTANGIDQLTIHQREADRLNETCVGFLSADESYIIFRTMDDEHVRRGGRRYTNYRLFQEWEGDKSFACRADVSLLSPRHRVVCSEGIIDLIQIERLFYGEERWASNHIGLATCGTAHSATMRRLAALGFLSLDLDLYIDDRDDCTLDPALVAKARELPGVSPFFQTSKFSMRVFHNGNPGEKDFGVLADRVSREQVRV